ncbi:MAG: hypothetical protein PF437_08375 [Sulfurimonas sp.]|jgi:3-methyladenine DNA glycosylase Mpg|nr:hypothetical protein [Sulfurimonas sp.]
MNNLKNELIALHTIETDQIQGQFKKIAQLLMGKYAIEYNGRNFLLDEIEFYFCSSNHIDVYSHSINEKNMNECISKDNNEQGKMLHWYFHGSGIDITFGDKDKGIYGGILIRKIFDIQNAKVIGGPLKLREHILGGDTSKSVECKYKVGNANIEKSDLKLITL